MKKICEMIAEIIGNYVENFELGENDYDKMLTELGIDSIAFIHIIVEIEEKFNIEIPDEHLLISVLCTIEKMAVEVMVLKEKDIDYIGN